MGSSPACYTKWAVMFQGWRKTFAMLLEGFDSLTVHKIIGWCNGSTSGSGPDDIGSSPILITEMLALAYLVKHHTVNVENRVRSPESTNTACCNGNIIISLSF